MEYSGFMLNPMQENGNTYYQQSHTILDSENMMLQDNSPPSLCQFNDPSPILNNSFLAEPNTIYNHLLITPILPSTTMMPSTIQQKRRLSLSSSSSCQSSSKTVLFRCEYKGCNKSFTRTYNLKSHYRTHTDEKPFVCHHCPKAFARQHDRNRHEKLHSGIKPYPCQFCQKSFARQDALNRHLKRDTTKKKKKLFNFDCPPCLFINPSLKKKKSS